jgi:hypothetical protein
MVMVALAGPPVGLPARASSSRGMMLGIARAVVENNTPTDAMI